MHKFIFIFIINCDILSYHYYAWVIIVEPRISANQYQKLPAHDKMSASAKTVVVSEQKIETKDLKVDATQDKKEIKTAEPRIIKNKNRKKVKRYLRLNNLSN